MTEHVIVEFFRAGDKDMIRQELPGNIRAENLRNVRAEDLERWPSEWEAYQSGKPAEQTGTPLSDIPGMTTPMMLTLQLKGITSVEQLAEANDGTISDVMGSRALRASAQNLIKLRESNAAMEAAEAKEAELLARVAELEAAQKIGGGKGKRATLGLPSDSQGE